MAPGSSRYFVGMPTPAAAGMIAAIIHCFSYPIEDVKVSLLWLLLILVLGILMSSTVRYYSFKDIQWTRRQPSLAVVLLALLVGAVVYFFKTHIARGCRRLHRSRRSHSSRAHRAPSPGFPRCLKNALEVWKYQ